METELIAHLAEFHVVAILYRNYVLLPSVDLAILCRSRRRPRDRALRRQLQRAGCRTMTVWKRERPTSAAARVALQALRLKALDKARRLRQAGL